MRQKPRCHNCKFAGENFKINKLTHMHCEHPKHRETFDKGELSPWDTLREWYNTCQSHEPKIKENEPINN